MPPENSGEMLRQKTPRQPSLHSVDSLVGEINNKKDAFLFKSYDLVIDCMVFKTLCNVRFFHSHKNR